MPNDGWLVSSYIGDGLTSFAGEGVPTTTDKGAQYIENAIRNTLHRLLITD